MAVKKENVARELHDLVDQHLAPGEVIRSHSVVMSSPRGFVGLMILLGQVKTYCVAVTDSRVIFARASDATNRLKTVEFTDDSSGASLTDVRPKMLWTLGNYNRPDGSVIKLRAARPWRNEFYAIAEAMGSAAARGTSGGS